MANQKSSASIIFIPEIFDSELIDPEKTKPTWPHALLRTRGDRASVDRNLGLVLGAKKLRPGKIIEKFGVDQTWARAKAAALRAGFEVRQLAPLPYDWRREPLDAVLDLRAFTPPGDGPVIIVGHGYGGLIAKALLQARPAWLERVTLVAHLGVPHHGSDLDHLFAIARPMGWISDLTWETMCGPRCSVPTRSIAAMTRPWAFGLAPRFPGVKELDVFSASYPTLMRNPEGPGDTLRVYPGDGFLLDVCMVREGIARLETDRYHADMPACPKFWRYLARKLGIARPSHDDLPASAAIHIQRSRLPAGVYVAGLRFQSRRNLPGVIEAREMTCRGGGFAPCKEETGQKFFFFTGSDGFHRPRWSVHSLRHRSSGKVRGVTTVRPNYGQGARAFRSSGRAYDLLDVRVIQFSSPRAIRVSLVPRGRAPLEKSASDKTTQVARRVDWPLRRQSDLGGVRE